MRDNKRTLINNIISGIIIGFIVPIITLYILYLVNQISVPFLEYISGLNENRILTKVISICTLPILGVFYYFLKKNWYSAVKGLIISVFALIFWVMYTNFL